MFHIRILARLSTLAAFICPLCVKAQITLPAMTQVEMMKITGITTDNQIYSLTPMQKQMERTYFDGFGRPIQKTQVQASPSQKDIITYETYNTVGTSGIQLSNYLPYVGADGSGAYHSSAASDQAAYYANGLSDKVTDDTKPWSQSVQEPSPLGRLLYVGTEGNGFQPVPGDNTQHYKSINLRSNNSSTYTNDGYNTGIRMWNYDGTSSGVYPSGSLAVKEITDEAGNVTLSYEDVNGRRILTRQIISAQIIDGTTENCLDTYYVYDDAGELRVIIPPKGLAAIRNANASPWNISLSAAAALTFQFNYDVLGRLIEKKVPGADWIYIVYDPINRPVLYQDGNLRGASNSINKWNYFKYDCKNRIASQGIYNDAVNGASRAAMQTYVNGLNYTTNYYETKQAGSLPNYYTNLVFPTANQNGTALQVLTYSYYDDYDFNNDGSPDYVYQAQGLTGEASPVTLLRGKLLGLFKKTLNNDGSLSVWLQVVNFYDKQGDLIQILSNNQTNSAAASDLTTSVPDFLGNCVQVKQSKTVSSSTLTTLKTYSYDIANRLVSIDQSNNGGSAIRVAQYVYNELGSLVTKRLHSTDGTNFLQNVDFRFNIKSALTSINNSTLSVDNTNYTNGDANDLFGEEILYEKTDGGIGNTAYYNGNISAVKWESQSTSNNSQRSYIYNYDQLNRISNAYYKDRAYQSMGAWANNGYNDEKNISYDLNGNIEALQRWSLNTKIDDLAYSYNGNQLNNVTDAGTTAGFNGTNTTGYSYDNIGNLSTDPKKGVAMSYNVLNKVDKITFTASGNFIRYTYDATGNLIRKETSVSGTITTYDYIDGFVYQNLTLSYFPTPEGRVRNNAGTLVFEYFIRDHLDNVRISFDGTGSSAVAREENSYYPFGMTLPGNLLPTSPNKNLFNGGSEWQNDFGNLPDLYQTFFRSYDAQLGRFISVDPKAVALAFMSTYNFSGNNPVSFNDVNGDMAYDPSIHPDWLNNLYSQEPDLLPGGGNASDSRGGMSGSNGGPQAGFITSGSFMEAWTMAAASLATQLGATGSITSTSMVNSTTFRIDYSYMENDGEGSTMNSVVKGVSLFGITSSYSPDGIVYGIVSPRSFNFQQTWPGSRQWEAGVTGMLMQVTVKQGTPAVPEPDFVREFDFATLYVEFPKSTWLGFKYNKTEAAVLTARAMQSAVHKLANEMEIFGASFVAGVSNKEVQSHFMAYTALYIGAYTLSAGYLTLDPIGRKTVVSPIVWIH